MVMDEDEVEEQADDDERGGWPWEKRTGLNLID